MSNTLTELFAAMTNHLQQDRESLNTLDDHGDGDAGDNMVHNFQTITNALRQVEGQPITVDQALNHASQVLAQQGQGATAPLYANGLRQAASELQGKESFGLDDIGGLLSGLMRGAQQTEGASAPGSGSLLDSLVPGVMGFMQARNEGKSTIESLLNGFLQSQRGAYGTARSQSPFGRFTEQDTQGRVDPGAAGASSLLGSLFNALLGGGLSAGRGEPQTSSGLGGLFGRGLEGLFGSGGGGLGGLFGGGGGGSWGSQGGQTGNDHRSEPRARLDDSSVV